jgi:hypothetical protein
MLLLAFPLAVFLNTIILLGLAFAALLVIQFTSVFLRRGLFRMGMKWN